MALPVHDAAQRQAHLEAQQAQQARVLHQQDSPMLAQPAPAPQEGSSVGSSEGRGNSAPVSTNSDPSGSGQLGHASQTPGKADSSATSESGQESGKRSHTDLVEGTNNPAAFGQQSEFHGMLKGKFEAEVSTID